MIFLAIRQTIYIYLPSAHILNCVRHCVGERQLFQKNKIGGLSFIYVFLQVFASGLLFNFLKSSSDKDFYKKFCELAVVFLAVRSIDELGQGHYLKNELLKKYLTVEDICNKTKGFISIALLPQFSSAFGQIGKVDDMALSYDFSVLSCLTFAFLKCTASNIAGNGTYC